jgi:hypothetical protein
LLVFFLINCLAGRFWPFYWLYEQVWNKEERNGSSFSRVVEQSFRLRQLASLSAGSAPFHALWAKCARIPQAPIPLLPACGLSHDILSWGTVQLVHPTAPH